MKMKKNIYRKFSLVFMPCLATKVNMKKGCLKSNSKRKQ